MNFILGTVGLICFLGLLVGPSKALSFDGIDEKYQCDKFPVQLEINETWISSVDKWYIPLCNKVELYHNAKQFYGNEQFIHLNQHDLDKTCWTYKENGTIVTYSAFGDHRLDYHTYPDPLRAGIYYWSSPGQSGKYEYVSTSYTTFSDNANYVVNVCIWNDGRKGFTVGSPRTSLDTKSLRAVKSHLRKLGFNSRHFVYYNYDQCHHAV